MARVRDELTAGEWALLALVKGQPTHGFGLARAMAPEGEVGHVWAYADRWFIARWRRLSNAR